MNRIAAVVAALSIAASLSFAKSPASSDIVDTAVEAGNFTTLVKAVTPRSVPPRGVSSPISALRLLEIFQYVVGGAP